MKYDVSEHFWPICHIFHHVNRKCSPFYNKFPSECIFCFKLVVQYVSITSYGNNPVVFTWSKYWTSVVPGDHTLWAIGDQNSCLASHLQFYSEHQSIQTALWYTEPLCEQTKLCSLFTLAVNLSLNVGKQRTHITHTCDVMVHSLFVSPLVTAFKVCI